MSVAETSTSQPSGGLLVSCHVAPGSVACHQKAIASLPSQKQGRAGSSVSCQPNCTLLAGFRVLLVSAFASYLACILITWGIWCPKYFNCHPLDYCHPPC